ncbi:MAG: MFS transporter [Oscillospiraceae bacterium]|jgi:MFS family permease|nr:MFS transporter [Oscillospiraceae bacterium]
MQHKKNVALIIALLALASISQSNNIASVIMADLVRAFPAASPTAIQYVMQMGMIGAFPISLSVGFLTRKFRIKSMLLTGAACIVIGGTIPLFAHTQLAILYVCAFIVGAGQGFMLPLITTLIMRHFEGRRQHTLLGLNTTFSTGVSTLLLLVAGPLAVKGWVNIFYLYLMAVPVFLIALLCLPNSELTPPAPAGAAKKVPVPVKGWIQCVLVVLMFVCYVTFPLNVSLYVSAEHLGDATVSGLAMSITTVVGAGVGVIFQPLIRRVKLYVGTLAAFFGFAGMLAVTLFHGVTFVYLSAALIGVFFGAQIIGGSYVVGRLCAPDQIAPTLSISMSFMTLGVILSPILINALTALWGGLGSKGAFTTSAALFGIILVLQIIWNTYLTKTCPEPAPETGPAA